MIGSLVSRLGASSHRKVLSAAAIVAAFTFSAKIASAVKELVVASQFGTSDAVDAFLLAFLMPSFAMSVVGGSLNSALLPAYVELRERQGQPAAQRLLSSVMTLSLGILVVVATVLAALVPRILPIVSNVIAGEKLTLTTELSYLLLPCLVLAGTTSSWSAVLNAHGKFARAASAPLAIPILSIVGLLALGSRWGIHALAVGTVAGFAVEAALVGSALRREGVRLVPRWTGLTPPVRRVLAQYAPMAAGGLVMSTNSVVDSLMAARLTPGSVASLGYANKLVAFGMGIGAVSLSSAVFPHFSRLVATRDWDRLRRTLRQYVVAMLALTIPVTVAGVLASRPIVRLLYERGAFTVADTVVVGEMQALYLLQIPFHLTGLLFVKFVSATAQNRVLMWVSAASTIVNVAANVLLVRWLGPAGIALATSIVYVFTFTVLALWTRSRLARLGAGAPAAAAVGP
jgi:putative peptidoglycan lipid II flippase